MTSPASERVLHVDRLELSFEPQSWDYADRHRHDIDALFASMQQKKPALFNGRILLMHRCEIHDGVLSGGFLEADYASFSFWRASGCPEAGVRDCFGAAAVMSSDGAFLLGEMGAHTFNAGQIYFPCGTPDLSDLVGHRVDFDMSVRRELSEETGLDAAELAEERGWTLAIDDDLICAIKVMQSPLDAVTLRARMLRHLASEQLPELADIRIVRGPDDFSPAMRSFVRIFLTQRFLAGGATP